MMVGSTNYTAAEREQLLSPSRLNQQSKVMRWKYRCTQAVAHLHSARRPDGRRLRPGLVPLATLGVPEEFLAAGPARLVFWPVVRL